MSELEYYSILRKKLVFHIKKIAPETNQITPRQFHKIILPLFPTVSQKTLTRLLWEMCELHADRWIYHKLKKEWLDFDLK